MSALSHAPFLGTIADSMIGQTQFGPLLQALKAAGLDTHRLTRQLIARGDSLMQDPISTAVELMKHIINRDKFP